MANQPTPRTLQPPPDLPDMPDVSHTLTNYLRTFSLWCRHGFADKLTGSQALPGIMLQAYDPSGAPTNLVFRLQIMTTGSPPTPAITMTLVPTGSGRP